jgi:hypothetical protein
MLYIDDIRYRYAEHDIYFKLISSGCLTRTSRSPPIRILPGW